MKKIMMFISLALMINFLILVGCVKTTTLTSTGNPTFPPSAEETEVSGALSDLNSLNEANQDLEQVNFDDLNDLPLE